MNINDIDKEIENLRKRREVITKGELALKRDEILKLDWIYNHQWYFDSNWGVYGGTEYKIYSYTLDPLLEKIDEGVPLMGDSNYYFMNINLKKGRNSSFFSDKGKQHIYSQNLPLFIEFLSKYRPRIKNDDVKEKAELYRVLESLL